MRRTVHLVETTITTYSVTFIDGKIFRWANWRGEDVPLVLHSKRTQVVCGAGSRLSHLRQMERILGLDVPFSGRHIKDCIAIPFLIYVPSIDDRSKLLHFPRWEDVVFAERPRSERSQQELTSALTLWKNTKSSTGVAS